MIPPIVLIALAYNYTAAPFNSGIVLFYQTQGSWIGKFINSSGIFPFRNITASSAFVYNNGTLHLIYQNNGITYFCNFLNQDFVCTNKTLPLGQIFAINNTIFIQQNTTLFAYENGLLSSYQLPCNGKLLGYYKNPIEFCNGIYYYGSEIIQGASLLNSIPQILIDNRLYSLNYSFLLPSSIHPNSAIGYKINNEMLIAYISSNSLCLQYNYNTLRCTFVGDANKLSGYVNKNLFLVYTNSSGTYVEFQPLGVDIPLINVANYNSTYFNVSWTIPYYNLYYVTRSQLFEYLNGNVISSFLVNQNGSIIIKKSNGLQVEITDVDPFGEGSNFASINLHSPTSPISSTSSNKSAQYPIIKQFKISPYYLYAIIVAFIVLTLVFIRNKRKSKAILLQEQEQTVNQNNILSK